MQILLAIFLLFSGTPEWNRTNLTQEMKTLDTVRGTGRVLAEYPQFVVKDVRDTKLANEINALLMEDAMRRVSSSVHAMRDSFNSKYTYTVTYFDASIFSCAIVLTVNDNAISSFAINYDIRNDGPLFLSKLVASVDNYDSLFTRWRSKQQRQAFYTDDLTDLTWHVTPEGVGLMPRIDFGMRDELSSTLIGFKDNADLFQNRLNVVDRALKQ